MFAWSHANMPGIDPEIICHMFSIKADAKSIKQKPMRMNEERSHAIRDEVDRLLQAGFIRETFYPDWLSNLVFVKKKMASEEYASTLPISTRLARRTTTSSRGSISW